MDHTQVEFMAEEESIEVRLKFSEPAAPGNQLAKFELVCGNFGPIQAGNVISVPLWAALSMKQTGKCTIIPPAWFSPESLEAIKEEERRESSFAGLPNQFMINIAHLLFAHAPDDIPHGDEVKTIIKDIMDLRFTKLRKGMDAVMSTETSHAMLKNITPLEICRIRGFLSGSMEMLQKLEAAAHGVNPQNNYSQSQ